MEAHKMPDNFGYSAVGIKDLGATEYTLATIVCDRSGSVAAFQKELEKCIKEIVSACKYSKRADNLMVRLVMFDNKMTENHGFKLLESINLDDYDGCAAPGGMTALYDAANNAIMATTDYGKQLEKQDFTANAIICVVTDGDDNASTEGANSVKKALQTATKEEALESIVSILVGVNVQDPAIKDKLDEFHKQAGFTQYVDAGAANAKSLAKLATFVSQSISSQSKSLGTGGPSKSLTF
jgi:uncharacterized protein YegL